MSGVLLVERAILESIQKEPMGILGLTKDIGVKKEIISNAIRSLINENLICFTGGKYELNNSILGKKRFHEINSKASIMEEYLDITQNMNNLDICKLSLDSFEEKLLQVHLKSFYEFITGIRQAEENGFKKTSNFKTCDKKLFVLGFSKYGEVIKNSLKVSH